MIGIFGLDRTGGGSSSPLVYWITLSKLNSQTVLVGKMGIKIPISEGLLGG